MSIVDVVAGTIGGIVVVVVGHPFDTTKTRLQTAPKNFYTGTFDCVKKTLNNEGVKGFYAGIWSPLYGQMIYRACHFGAFYYFKDKFSSQLGSPTVGELLLAGSSTGLAVSIVENPIDLLKTKLQVQVFGATLKPNVVPKYTSTLGCLKYIVTTHGPQGLLQGLSGTVIRNIPANALFFSINEISKKRLAEYHNVEIADLPVAYKLLSGSLSGIGYWCVTYPLDVVKASMQSQNYEKRLSWWATALKIFNKGGWAAFGNGFVPCALRSIPACGCMFATVDYVRANLHKVVEL